MRGLTISVLGGMALWAQGVSAAQMSLAEPCKTGLLLQQHDVKQQYVAGDFHLFYSLSGPDALADIRDDNGNNTPDRVEDIATQLQAARYFYSAILGLRFPLEQPVFRHARQVNVYVLALKKGNGSAFDKVANETLTGGQKTGCGIKIVINRGLDPLSNVTPAHELFHLYQYGYALFKQKWYLEGMARWVQDPFTPPSASTPAVTGPGACRDNYARSYQASAFWSSYAQEYFAPVRFSRQAADWQYLNGMPVFHKNLFPGGTLLRPFFQQLSRASEQQAQKSNTANINWTEQQQRSPDYNDVICNTLQSIRSPGFW